VSADVDPVGTDPLVALLGRAADDLHTAVRVWHDAEKAEAVREALDKLIEAHAETFGPAGSVSRMWLRERRAALEQS
jgi:hypothetical protein